MKNDYFLMRHGRSESNDLKVIACSPGGSLHGFGLTEKGLAQAKAAAKRFANYISDTPLIFSSDFLRAHQTAEEIAVVCDTKFMLDKRLRERDFGSLDGASTEQYYKTWDADTDPDAIPYGSESLRDMVDRVWSLILQIEEENTGRTVLLVSHGDPMVAVNSFAMHGDYRPPIHYIGNAEIRRIDQAVPFISVE